MYRLSELLMPQLPQTDQVAAAPDWTRAQFNRKVFALSYAFRRQNIRAVALWFEDAAAFACALLGAWHSGATVLLPPNASEDNRAWAAEHNALWLHDAGDAAAFGGGAEHFPAWLSALPDAPSEYLADARLPEEAELFLKTSGSSGVAQIVRKTAAQLSDEAAALTALPFSDGQAVSVVGSVSPQHLYGLTFRVVLPLSMGWTLTREQNVYPETLLSATAGQSRCIWISSPALLSRLGAMRDWAAVRGNIAAIVSSGGALDGETSDLLAKYACRPWEIYGSTETGVIAARQGRGAWRPLEGAVLRQTEDGTLNVALPWSGGAIQTADVVEFGKDGGFTLLGRSDRIVKLEDKRVSLAQIEQDLRRHPWLDDAYCGLHPKHKRPAVWAALNSDGIEALCTQGRAAVTAQLRRYAAKSLDSVALPRYWRLTDRLPRNAQSKLTAADFQTAFTEPSVSPEWTEMPSEQPDEYRFGGRVPLDLTYFGGHFAEFPLVPGVVELQWVRDLAQRCGWRQSVLRVENLKYQQFVRPHDSLEVSLSYDAAKNRASFKIMKDGEVCASGRLVFGSFGAAE